MAPGRPVRTRSKAQILGDRVEIARRYLEGQFQHEIANALEVTQQQISYDLKAIQESWQDIPLRELSELKAKELAKIDNLERNYWQAWEQSKQPKESSLTAKAGESLRVERRSEQRSGNPSYLTGVQWCIDRRCKILGLDAPIKTANEVSMTPQQRQNKIAEIQSRLQQNDEETE